MIFKKEKRSLPTFSIRDTKMLAKHGKLGTRGLRVMRGRAKTWKSTTCNIQSTVPLFLSFSLVNRQRDKTLTDHYIGEKLFYNIKIVNYLNSCFKSIGFHCNSDVRISSPFQSRLHNQLLFISKVDFHTCHRESHSYNSRSMKFLFAYDRPSSTNTRRMRM